MLSDQKWDGADNCKQRRWWGSSSLSKDVSQQAFIDQSLFECFSQQLDKTIDMTEKCFSWFKAKRSSSHFHRWNTKTGMCDNRIHKDKLVAITTDEALALLGTPDLWQSVINRIIHQHVLVSKAVKTFPCNNTGDKGCKLHQSYRTSVLFVYVVTGSGWSCWFDSVCWHVHAKSRQSAVAVHGPTSLKLLLPGFMKNCQIFCGYLTWNSSQT